MALENWARNWSCGKGARPGDVASQYHEDAVRQRLLQPLNMRREVIIRINFMFQASRGRGGSAPCPRR